MNKRFDLHETQLNILEKCPEWQDLMNVVRFKDSPEAKPVTYADNNIYYNSRRLDRFPQDTVHRHRGLCRSTPLGDGITCARQLGQ